MTQKQSWSRAQNVCNKVSQDGQTGNKSRKIMRSLATTKEMRKRYSLAHVNTLTHKQCKRMVRSDIAAIDRHHKAKMKEKWRKIPRSRRAPFKEWLRTNKHNNPVDQSFKEDVEYLFNSE